MSLKFPHKFTSTIGFRLTTWYVGVFIASSVILFSLAYLFLSSSLEIQEQDAVRLKVRELSAVYQSGGLSYVYRVVAADKLNKRDEFLFRIADASNSTLFINSPYGYTTFFQKKLEEITPVNGKWIRLPYPSKNAQMELSCTQMSNGHWLQLGKSTQERGWLLGHFRRVFVAALIPLVVLGFMGGIFFAFRALRPIKSLIHLVQSVDIGKMDARVPSPETGDELDQLVKIFNAMLGRIDNLIKGMKASLDNVAHDLRTPMTRLRGIAEMAVQDQNPNTYREALIECIEESERILTILNTLMDISEAETGAMKLDKQTVNISSIAEGVVDVYSYVAEEKNISLHSVLPANMLVTADPTRIGQVLANLMDNAIKYTPSGGKVYITAAQKADQVIVTVQDTGIGIRAEELPRIWDRLYRGDRSRSKKGLGLGLSLVKAIVQAHDGRVEASSEPGKGSSFSIYIPSANA